MDYIKLIPQISGEECADQARYYDNTFADELYYELTGEYSILEDMTAVETIAAMAEEADIPLNVLAHVDFAEELEALLGFGASRIILKTSDVRTDSLNKAIQEIDGDYIYLYMEADNMESDLLRARQALEEDGFGGIVLAGDYKDPSYLQIADFLKVKTGAPVYLFVDTVDHKDLSYVMKMTNGCGIILKNPAGQDIYVLKKDLAEEGLALNIFEADFTFDDFKLNSDGMIPVVTQDHKTGQVLMVAYMNREAFDHTVKTGKMTYFSRSRQELWCKGDTSGHYQYIKSLAIDCDNDTILAKVSQVGAACHTGNYSCFYRDLVHKKW